MTPPRTGALAIAAVVALAWFRPACAVSALDDSGRRVELAQAARRIVSLSPGITELLFSVGAGDRLVAASEYSDAPEAARELPRVARAQGVDFEQIARLRPDLIITWGSGYSPATLQGLRRLGAPVYVHEPQTLEAIATSIERFGELTGSMQAPQVAARFRARLAGLRTQYSRRKPVRVFYQAWASPLMTLTGRHPVSEVMQTCGARNVFAELGPLVATVDVESVLAARPELIVASEPGGLDRGALDGWKRFAQLPAVAGGHLVTLDADELDRSTLRVLDAAASLCEQVERARH